MTRRAGTVTRGSGPTLREEQRALTRSRLLQAMVTVAEQKSVLDLTIDDLAKAAGVTRATVYAHFDGGKAALLEALGQEIYAVLGELYAELVALPEWSVPAVRTWLDGVAARWRVIAPIARVLDAPGVRMPDAAREHERFVALIAEDPGRWPTTPPAEARQRALMAVLQLESFLSVWLTNGWDPGSPDPLDLVADVVGHLLAPSAARGPGG
jgi:AcrR family transcriptional regulator